MRRIPSNPPSSETERSVTTTSKRKVLRSASAASISRQVVRCTPGIRSHTASVSTTIDSSSRIKTWSTGGVYSDSAFLVSPSSFAQPLGQPGEALPGLAVAHRDAQRPLLAHQDRQPPGAGDRRVEEVALQHQVV